MFEQFTEFIRKSARSAARIFTWPNRYLTERFGSIETPAGITITPEKSLECSAVAACVRLISETIAALPLHIYRNVGRSNMIAADHPQYSLLRSSPNEFQTSFTFIQQALTQCLLHGNFYALIERSADGAPAALWPLLPHGVIVQAIEGTVSYRYVYGGQIFNYRDILHFKGLSLDGFVGRGIIDMAREGIGLALAEQDYSSRFFKNDARPGGVVEGFNFKTLEDEKAFIELWQQRQTGANRHKTTFLPSGMTYREIGVKPNDSQLIEARHFSVIEIARWFRVPPTLIGDMTRVSYASSESEMQLFAMHTLVPWCANMEGEINKKFFPEGSEYLAKFDVNSIIRGDQASRYTAYSQGLTAGFLTVADCREAEGLAFIAGTEGLNRPANMTPHEMPAGGANDGTPEPAA